MCVCVLGWVSPLPLFENSKRWPDFVKRVPWFWSKFLGLCITHELNSHLKYSYKSILVKKHQRFSLRSLSFICRTWNVYRSVPNPRNFLCPEKFLVSWLRNLCGKLNNFLHVFYKRDLRKSFSKLLMEMVFPNMESYQKLEVVFLKNWSTGFSKIVAVDSLFWCKKACNSLKVPKCKNEIYQWIDPQRVNEKVWWFVWLSCLLPEIWSLKCQECCIFCVFCWWQQKTGHIWGTKNTQLNLSNLIEFCQKMVG